MSDVQLTCPYCNALQPYPLNAVVGQKHACIRCGDAFVLREVPVKVTSAGAVSGEPSSARIPPPRIRKPIRANRIVAAIVLGVMLLMAATGLTYALLTVDTRRAHDHLLPRKVRKPWLTPTTPVDPGEPIKPGQLLGLQYLPPSTALVLGVHIEDLLASPVGKVWHSQPLKLGKVEITLDSLRDWTGLDIDNLDHLVAGMVLRQGKETDLTPPVHVVIRTRKPYKPERVRVALKAGKSVSEKANDGTRRTIYSANIRNLPARLWLIDEKTLMLSLLTPDLDAVPGLPDRSLSALPKDLQDTINGQLSGGLPVWIAGHSDDWNKTLLGIPLIQEAIKDVPLISLVREVKTFALWLVPTQPPRVGGAFHCASAEITTRIEKEVLIPRQKANPENFKYSRRANANWLDVQMTLISSKGS